MSALTTIGVGWRWGLMPSRFHCPQFLQAGPAFVLPPEASHHAMRVLRLRYGEAVYIFDGEGVEYRAVLTEIDGKPGVVLGERVEENREAPFAVTLVQALAVADKMDWIVQKAVEMGAVGVQPVEAERSVLRLAGERGTKRVEHWRQVAASAAEQCGRSRLCAVGDLRSLPQWLGSAAAGQRWILTPEGGTPLSAMPRPEAGVSLLIGPEGGWSEKEVAAALAAGCQPVRLGPRVLRTETAGVAAIAAMMALWGDF
jgi:16S rRNA (uracil1498-N3)-methyltransferase